MLLYATTKIRKIVLTTTRFARLFQLVQMGLIHMLWWSWKPLLCSFRDGVPLFINKKPLQQHNFSIPIVWAWFRPSYSCSSSTLSVKWHKKKMIVFILVDLLRLPSCRKLWMFFMSLPHIIFRASKLLRPLARGLTFVSNARKYCIYISAITIGLCYIKKTTAALPPPLHHAISKL